MLYPHQECGQIPINNKRHYTWAFTSLEKGKAGVTLNIVNAYEKHRADITALKATVDAIPGNDPTFVVMDANYGLRSGDYPKRTAELKAMQLTE